MKKLVTLALAVFAVGAIAATPAPDACHDAAAYAEWAEAIMKTLATVKGTSK